jgi:hypothetical protein
LKTDGVWDKLTEFYLLAGKTFGGLTVKGKAVPDSLEYASDFSAGVDGWMTAGCSLLAVDGVGPTGDLRDNCLEMTVSALNEDRQWRRAVGTQGQTYLLSFEYYIPTSNADVVQFRTANYTTSARFSTQGAWVSASEELVASVYNNPAFRPENSSFQSEFLGNGTDVIYVRNVRVTQLNGSLTNNNFVTGDYLGVGTGAGLTGNGNTKYLDTGLSGGSLDGDDHSLSVYVQAFTISGRFLVGMRDGVGITAGTEILVNSEGHQVRMPFSSAGMATSANGASYLVGSRRGANDAEAYVNGVSDATDTSTASLTLASYPYYLFAANDGGSSLSRSDATITFAHIGTGLTDTDASNLSLRVNKLMYDLGCETYVDQGILDAMTLDADAKTYAEAVLTAGGNFEGA